MRGNRSHLKTQFRRIVLFVATLVFLSNRAEARISDDFRIRAAMHSFFASFEGRSKPVEKMLELLDPTGFLIHSSRTRLSSAEDLKNYFDRRAAGELSSHRIIEFSSRSVAGDKISVTLMVHYRRWDPTPDETRPRFVSTALRYDVMARIHGTSVSLVDVRFQSAGVRESSSQRESTLRENQTLAQFYHHLADQAGLREARLLRSNYAAPATSVVFELIYDSGDRKTFEMKCFFDSSSEIERTSVRGI